jgi:16S rRNA (guanine527-N7)-methyltransferase
MSSDRRSGATVPPEAIAYGAAEFRRDTGVSRETLAKLEAYAATLVDWQQRLNLIAESTVSQLWWRHMLDSAQLAPLIPRATETLIDIGSGAGFPGLVLAIMGAARRVTLIESDGKKCAFLRAASAAADTKLDIRNARAESLELRGDVVTARACAPLDRLIPLALELVKPGGLCLFPKGAQWDKELTAAKRHWTMEVQIVPSRTEPAARILCLREIAPCPRRPPQSRKSRRE